MIPVRDMSAVRTVIFQRHQAVRNMLGTGYTPAEVAREFNMRPEEVIALRDEAEGTDD